VDATKEDSRKCSQELENIARTLDLAGLDPETLNHVKRDLVRVQSFVEACEKRLPSEAAVARDRARRRAKQK
jgi:hypothetical protein